MVWMLEEIVSVGLSQYLFCYSDRSKRVDFGTSLECLRIIVGEHREVASFGVLYRGSPGVAVLTWNG